MSASQLIQDFAKRGSSAAFPQIARSDVVDGLLDRTKAGGEKNIDQARSSLCGPACVMFCFAARQQEKYVRYVIDLYEQGEAQFGTLTVKPGAVCRSYTPSGIDPVDWIALASLRDSENRYLDYKSVESDAAGITLPGTMVKWFRSIGYGHVQESTQLFGGMVQNDDHIRKAGSLRTHGLDVCLFINAQMLYPNSMAGLSLNPNHWVLMLRAIGIDTKTRRISMEVFTWGGTRLVPVTQSGIGNLDDFLKNYYGYVAAAA